MNKKAIGSALATLIKEGRKAFCEDAKVSDAECIGLAISRKIYKCDELLEIAASGLEDWNHHTECGILRKLIKGEYQVDQGSRKISFKL